MSVLPIVVSLVALGNLRRSCLFVMETSIIVKIDLWQLIKILFIQ